MDNIKLSDEKYNMKELKDEMILLLQSYGIDSKSSRFTSNNIIAQTVNDERFANLTDRTHLHDVALDDYGYLINQALQVERFNGLVLPKYNESVTMRNTKVTYYAMAGVVHEVIRAYSEYQSDNGTYDIEEIVKILSILSKRNIMYNHKGALLLAKLGNYFSNIDSRVTMLISLIINNTAMHSISLKGYTEVEGVYNLILLINKVYTGNLFHSKEAITYLDDIKTMINRITTSNNNLNYTLNLLYDFYSRDVDIRCKYLYIELGN